MRKFIKQAVDRLLGRIQPVTLESEVAKRVSLLVDDKSVPASTIKVIEIRQESKENDPEPIIYELPVVPVIKRKSKTRDTAKTIRKSRKRIARKGRK